VVFIAQHGKQPVDRGTGQLANQPPLLLHSVGRAADRVVQRTVSEGDDLINQSIQRDEDIQDAALHGLATGQALIFRSHRSLHKFPAQVLISVFNH